MFSDLQVCAGFRDPLIVLCEFGMMHFEKLVPSLETSKLRRQTVLRRVILETLMSIGPIFSADLIFRQTGRNRILEYLKIISLIVGILREKLTAAARPAPTTRRRFRLRNPNVDPCPTEVVPGTKREGRSSRRSGCPTTLPGAGEWISRERLNTGDNLLTACRGNGAWVRPWRTNSVGNWVSYGS